MLSCKMFLNLFAGCGESRSLMKELASAVSSQQDQFGALKLMLLYRNAERVLAHTLGASEGITVIYFHHSQSYKYGGRLRVQNILSSVEHAMSLLSKGHPLKPLKSPEELRNFLESTDKALLLLEFCDWTSKLLAKGKSNMTESAFGILNLFLSGMCVVGGEGGLYSKYCIEAVHCSMPVL